VNDAAPLDDRTDALNAGLRDPRIWLAQPLGLGGLWLSGGCRV